MCHPLHFTLSSKEPLRAIPWKVLELSTLFRNFARCPSGTGRPFRLSTRVIVSFSNETQIGGIRSLRCIWRLSLLETESKSPRKWQNATNWASLILTAINLARPLISALFEVVLRCSMWIMTVAYWLASSPQPSEWPTNTLILMRGLHGEASRFHWPGRALEC